MQSSMLEKSGPVGNLTPAIQSVAQSLHRLRYSWSIFITTARKLPVKKDGKI